MFVAKYFREKNDSQSTNHNSTKVGASQEEDVSSDLNVNTNVFSLRHVYESSARAGLNYPLATQQRDGANGVLCCLDFLEIIQ